MTQFTLAAAANAVCFCDTAMDAEYIEAWQNTFIFSYGHARTVDSVGTSKFFEAMTRELTNLGWDITSAGPKSYYAASGSTQASAIMASTLHPFLRADQQAMLDQAFTEMKSTDEPIKGLTDILWDKGQSRDLMVRDEKRKGDRIVLGIGSLSASGRGPTLTISFSDFPKPGSDWRSLYEDKPTSAIAPNIYEITLSLDMGPYDSIADPLREKIGSHMAEYATQVNVGS